MSDVSHAEDLRGSAPVLTARDVLLEVREDVRQMKSGVDILLSQRLDERVRDVERWQNRVIGLGMAGTLLGLIAIGMQLLERIGA